MSKDNAHRIPPYRSLPQGCEIFKDIPSLFVLEFLYRFGFDLADSFTGNTHHDSYFFKRKGPIVTGNPCTVQECFAFQTPLTSRVNAYFIN